MPGRNWRRPEVVNNRLEDKVKNTAEVPDCVCNNSEEAIKDKGWKKAEHLNQRKNYRMCNNL
jgi:hypothetical protein